MKISTFVILATAFVAASASSSLKAKEKVEKVEKVEKIEKVKVEKVAKVAKAAGFLVDFFFHDPENAEIATQAANKIVNESIVIIDIEAEATNETLAQSLVV